jgi:hypothetical protein
MPHRTPTDLDHLGRLALYEISQPETRGDWTIFCFCVHSFPVLDFFFAPCNSGIGMDNKRKLELQGCLAAKYNSGWANIAYTYTKGLTGLQDEALGLPLLPCGQLAIQQMRLLRDVSLQSCEIKSPNSEIRSPLNLQKTNGRHSLKSPKMSKISLAISVRERAIYGAASN